MELETLKTVISNILKVDPNEITEETTFLGDLGADSLDLFELVMEFDEIATSDGITPIRFYVYKYTGDLEGELTLSEEIEAFMWYDTTKGYDILSNTLKNEVVPYCLENKKII